MLVVPDIACAPEPPVNIILPAPECVALLVTFPFTVIVFPPSAKVPALMVRFPATVIADAAVFVLFPDNVKCP